MSTKKNPLRTAWGQAFDIKAFAYCPTCNAMPGANCKATDGKIREAAHQERQKVYQRALNEMGKLHQPAPKRELVDKCGPPKPGVLTKATIIAIVPCPKCGSDIGRNCKNPNGSRRKRSHEQRLHAAQAKVGKVAQERVITRKSSPAKTPPADDTGWYDVIE